MTSGEVLVVETERKQYPGTVEVQAGTVILRSGYVGRPVILVASEVVSICAPEFQATQ
jgi:hypothetical protein